MGILQCVRAQRAAPGPVGAGLCLVPESRSSLLGSAKKIVDGGKLLEQSQHPTEILQRMIMSRVWVGILSPGLSPQARTLSAARTGAGAGHSPKLQVPQLGAMSLPQDSGHGTSSVFPWCPFCLHLFYFWLVTCDQEKLPCGCWTNEQPVLWYL